MALQAPPQSFVDYSPNGQGYNFIRPDGSSAFFYGDYANQLRDNIDRTKPPDQRLAMNSPGNTGIANLPPDVRNGDAGLAGQIRSQQTSQEAAANNDFRTALLSGGQSLAHTNPPPGAPPGAPPPQPTLGAPPAASPSRGQGSGTTGPGLVAPPSGTIPMMRGGASPRANEGGSISPSDLPMPVSPYRRVAAVDPRKMVAQGVPVPVQQSLIREGGIENPEERQKAVEAYNAQVDAQKKLSEVEAGAYQAQAQQQRAEMLEQAKRQKEAEDEIVRQQARKQVVRQEYDRRLNIAQQDYDRSSKREVDQYRLFRGNPGGQFLAAIGITLGSIGQAMTHGSRNQALDQINRQMDNDIESQREEIQRGTAKANNDILRIREQYGLDTDDAANVLKFNLAKRAEAEAARKAAMIGTQQAQVGFAEIQPRLQAWQAEAADRLRLKLDGQSKTATEARFVQPHAGGLAMKTPEQYDKEVTQSLENAAKRSAYRSTVEHAGQAPGKQGAGGGGKLSARLSSTEAINEAGSEDIVQLMKSDPGGVLAHQVPVALQSQERIAYEAAVNAAAPKILAANGENQTEAALAAVKSQLLSPYESVRRAAQRRYLGANSVVHKAIERQRGQSVAPGGTSDEEP